MVESGSLGVWIYTFLERILIPNPRHLINASRNLRRKQKALSRKKGSAKRRKARIQLAGVHERVANTRADFQHKLSRAIVDENQAVIVETLKVENMMKKSTSCLCNRRCRLVWIHRKIGIQSSRERRACGETGTMVCQFENVSLLRSPNAGDAVK